MIHFCDPSCSVSDLLFLLHWVQTESVHIALSCCNRIEMVLVSLFPTPGQSLLQIPACHTPQGQGLHWRVRGGGHWQIGSLSGRNKVWHRASRPQSEELRSRAPAGWTGHLRLPSYAFTCKLPERTSPLFPGSTFRRLKQPSKV